VIPPKRYGKDRSFVKENRYVLKTWKRRRINVENRREKSMRKKLVDVRKICSEQLVKGYDSTHQAELVGWGLSWME
jgi:uncharacterized protein with WD repeat